MATKSHPEPTDARRPVEPVAPYMGGKRNLARRIIHGYELGLTSLR